MVSDIGLSVGMNTLSDNANVTNTQFVNADSQEKQVINNEDDKSVTDVGFTMQK